MKTNWPWFAGVAIVLGCLAFPTAILPQQEDPRKLPEKLAPFFRPPPGLAQDFGKYKSPLLFADGSIVKTGADWQKRRQEILKNWHNLMGPWPPVIAKPKIEYLAKEHRENFTQHHVRIEVAPGRMTDDAYLLVPDGKGPFPAMVVVYYDAKTGIGQGKAALRDYAYQLAKRGFVTLSVGSPPQTYYPNKEKTQLQPLSFHAYFAANCHKILAALAYVEARLIASSGTRTGASGRCSLHACTKTSRAASGPIRASSLTRNAATSITGNPGIWAMNRARFASPASRRRKIRAPAPTQR